MKFMSCGENAPLSDEKALRQPVLLDAEIHRRLSLIRNSISGLLVVDRNNQHARICVLISKLRNELDAFEKGLSLEKH